MSDILEGLPEHYTKALQIKESKKPINLPELTGWNSQVLLRPFQEKGVAWLYLAKRCLLADPTGFGKTVQAIGLVSLLKTQGKPYRTIVIVENFNTERQWYREFKRFTNLQVAPVNGEKPERVGQYAAWWEVLITRYSLLIRDLDYLKQLHFDMLICDDASYFRHHNIKTARCVKSLAGQADRIVLLDATPIQTSLLDMHSLMETLRMNVFGPLPAFENRYVRREPVKFRKGHSWIHTTKIIGYKNMREFKARIKPFILRRKLGEVEAQMPDIQAQDVWLTLPKVQRDYYNQARKGIIELYEAGDRRQMRAHFHHLQYACDTTLAFSEDRPSSVKIDWLMNELLHDLKGQKVIIFSKYKIGIEHLMQRLEAEDIGARRYTGDEPKEVRAEALDLFWNDPSMQVLVGTAALERGLNLQKSAYMIALNQMWNPQRMTQLVGRIRRIGSEHSKVFMINLLTEDTIEEKMQKVLEERAAVPDYVFGETTELFDKLSDEELISLIQE